MATAKRVERRIRRGFATRGEERRHRMRQRLAAAPTAEAQLTAAFDWFRSSARHVADADTRAGLMREMATALARAADEADGRAS